MESLSWLRCVLYDQWQNIVTLYFPFFSFFCQARVVCRDITGFSMGTAVIYGLYYVYGESYNEQKIRTV